MRTPQAYASHQNLALETLVAKNLNPKRWRQGVKV